MISESKLTLPRSQKVLHFCEESVIMNSVIVMEGHHCIFIAAGQAVHPQNLGDDKGKALQEYCKEIRQRICVRDYEEKKKR